MADFNIAIKPVLKHEGGYANVPGDKGGETYAGITRKNWPNWAGWKFVDAAKPLKGNQRVPDADLLAGMFYLQKYWPVIQGDRLNDQKVAGFLLDWQVNSGYHAILAAQRIVGAKPDGVLGPKTLAAINAYPDLFTELKTARIAFIHKAAKVGENAQFLEGWLNRINSFK